MLLAALLLSAVLIAIVSQPATARASFSLRTDPLIQEAKKLPVGNEVGPGLAGMSVAISADGNTALVGGPKDNNSAGAAWFFERGDGGWVQQGAKITAEAEGAGGALCDEDEEEGEDECAFGESVALSANGDTAIVGGPSAVGPCPSGVGECRRQGAAWVYTRSEEGRWSLQEKLTGGSEETSGGRFGRSVAISADGNTVLIGAATDRGAEGSAWVFAREGDTWSQQGQKLMGTSATPEGHFGVSVALSADGNTALIGGPGDSGRAGAVWVYHRSESSWGALAAILTGGEEQGEGRFGSSVALSGDGSTALVGGRGDNEGAGAAWVFTRAGGPWLQQGKKLTRGTEEESPSGFGYSVSLSNNGNTALIGGPRDHVGTGAAWLFSRAEEGAWSQEGEKLTGAGGAPHGARFGASVALRSDGATALIGAPSDSGREGAVRVFGDPGIIPNVTSVSPDAGPVGGGTTVTITGSHLAGATSVEFLSASCNEADEEGCSTPAASFTVNPSGSITAVSPERPAGRTYVVVTNIEGQNALDPASEFTFVQTPAVSEVSPAEGSTAGGTTVTIAGNHLGGASAVDFGAVAATSFIVNSERSITAVSPAESAAAVNVTVTTPGGTSRATTRNRFTFVSAARANASTAGAGATATTASGGVLAFATGCRASLASRKVAVLRRNRARVKLIWRGRASCRGKLRLSARVRVGKRYKSKTIGVATFSISPGRVRTVTLKLNAAGHALLRRGHGRLRASLLIGSLPPAARWATTAKVRLALQTTTATKPKKH